MSICQLRFSVPAPAVHCKQFPVRGAFGLFAAGLAAGMAHAQCTASWTPGFEATGRGMSGGVHALITFDDGTGPALYAGGSFTTAGGVAVNGIARWNGTAWSAVGGGVAGTFPDVAALAVYDSDGPGPGVARLHAAGFFTSAGGVAANNIASWDGTAWSALGAGTAGNTGINCLAVFGDHLYAGGSFTSAGGAPANYISRWDGSAWAWPGGASNGTSGGVYALAVYGGALYAGGAFPTAGTTTSARFIARWTTAGWSDLAGGLTTTVYALSVFDDGSGPALYAGGNFTGTFAGLPASRIARWNGAAWSALGTGVAARVRGLVVFDDTNGPALYATGDSGPGAPGISKWSGGAWSALGAGLVGAGRTMAAFDDDAGGPIPPSLYVGGDFSHAGGLPSSNFARWGCGVCYANCDSSTTAPVLNVNDFICFQQKYAAGDAYANCDGSTTPPVLNVNDFVCFQQKYAAGCP